uniref:ATP synthase subunit a n=1 Tax=Gmelinoides fasciatus TaxID=686704 RepID=A0A1L5BW44_9CRUS|nr:ATP synthase F0 subunit 6 [Gmelinoides fasciatus]APL97186.1 ATP synthase F0 subunit 6 [Gmelinoides fasciatus]
MMTNLFSVFDPSTPYLLSCNWVSIIVSFSFLPLLLWVSPCRVNKGFLDLYTYLISEFKPLVNKLVYTLILPTTFFMIIMVGNTVGLLPYVFTYTSQLSMAASLALPVWVSMMMYGWINNTSNLLAHLIPLGTPSILTPFMVLIETISNLIRPLTLTVRLTANMVAGHLLIVLLSSANPAPMPLTPIIFVSNFTLLVLELAVAFIQAYVFSVLITLYMSEFSN